MVATGLGGGGAEHNGPEIRFLGSQEPDIFGQHGGNELVPALADESERTLFAENIVVPWYPLFLEGKVVRNDEKWHR